MEKLEVEQPPRNLFLSPCSLALCLAIAFNGAVGQTREELAGVLGMEGVAEKEVNRRFRNLRAAVAQTAPPLELDLASAIWGSRTVMFAVEFLQRIQEFYAADARTLDLEGPAAAAAVNRWVSSRTNGRITTLVHADDLASGVSCVLTSAVYFKGSWSASFDPRATQDKPFFLFDGKRKDVPMMSRSGRYPYLQTKDFQAIAVGYAGDSLSMYVFLPREGDFLDTSGWQEWLPQFRITQVDLVLPRFSLTCALDLVRTLGELGLGGVFQPGADFSRMGPTGYFISAIKHKARIDVSEEGTEAVASSAVVMGRSLTRATPMFVDRPFYLAIVHHRSGVLLFLGKVVEPEPPS